MELDEGSGIYPHWIAAHAHLKNEFTEDEKYHNLMSWLLYNSQAAIPVPDEGYDSDKWYFSSLYA